MVGCQPCLRSLSTDPASDLDVLFRRAVFAWLIADGDMHLKNLAVLKVAEVDAKTFKSVRFAPLYDAVTTRVFPGLGGRSHGAEAQRRGWLSVHVDDFRDAL